MKYYAVINTNVLVSVMLKWDSVLGNILELIFKGLIIPIYNNDILKKYYEVLLRPKFHLKTKIVDVVIRNIKQIGINIESKMVDIIFPIQKIVYFMKLPLKKGKPMKHI